MIQIYKELREAFQERLTKGPMTREESKYLSFELTPSHIATRERRAHALRQYRNRHKTEEGFVLHEMSPIEERFFGAAQLASKVISHGKRYGWLEEVDGIIYLKGADGP